VDGEALALRDTIRTPADNVDLRWVDFRCWPISTFSAARINSTDGSGKAVQRAVLISKNVLPPATTHANHHRVIQKAENSNGKNSRTAE
jgi:hypothetical protein